MSIRRCLRCHDWSKCAGYTYFLPAEVDGHWCWHQVIFLIMARDCILDMSWPAEPSDYVDQGKHRIRAAAPFEGSLAVVCGQFSRRWRHLILSDDARKDIGTLEHEVANGWELWRLCPVDRSIVYYLLKPRRMLYHDWASQQDRRNEGSGIQNNIGFR